eukprot:878737_1
MPSFTSKSVFVVLYHVFTSVISQTISCGDAYSCVGTAFDTPTYIHFHGYKSGFGPTTSWNGHSLNCRGSHSCAEMAFMRSVYLNGTGSTSCSGTLSCSNTSYWGCTNWGNGANSLSFTSITSHPNCAEPFSLYCYGQQSCSHTFIHHMPRIFAHGSQSLYKSTIDTTNPYGLANFTLFLAGDYAAYGAKMTCAAGTQCNIHCLAYNSCFNFYVDCDGDCIINTLFNGKHSIPPITDLSEFDPNAHAPILWPVIFDSFYFTATDDLLCETSNAATLADDIMQFGHDLNITVANEGPLCCRARQSCKNVPNIELQNITPTNVICTGGYSCGNANIYSNGGNVSCNARNSCRDGLVSDAMFLYCAGIDGCQTMTIDKVRTILCSGGRSCRGSTITSNGTDLDVHFTGKDSGNATIVVCSTGDVCNIKCSGYNSCGRLTVNCDGVCDVSCIAQSGCPNGYTPQPSHNPTPGPTLGPTKYPSRRPTDNPTVFPTKYPSRQPTDNPTLFPTRYPLSLSPSYDPILSPTLQASPPSPRGNNPTSSPKEYTTDSAEQEQEQGDVQSDDGMNEFAWLFSMNRLIVVCIVGICLICCLVICIVSAIRYQKRMKQLRQMRQCVAKTNIETEVVDHPDADVTNNNNETMHATVVKDSVCDNSSVVFTETNIAQMVEDDEDDEDEDDLWQPGPTATTTGGTDAGDCDDVHCDEELCGASPKRVVTSGGKYRYG